MALLPVGGHRGAGHVDRPRPGDRRQGLQGEHDGDDPLPCTLDYLTSPCYPASPCVKKVVTGTLTHVACAAVVTHHRT